MRQPPIFSLLFAKSFIWEAVMLDLTFFVDWLSEHRDFFA
jgi:hypothetical protein